MPCGGGFHEVRKTAAEPTCLEPLVPRHRFHPLDAADMRARLHSGADTQDLRAVSFARNQPTDQPAAPS